MTDVEQYIEQVDEKRRPAFRQLYEVIKKHLPDGFEVTMQYQMPTFVVPLSRYPNGYLNRKDEALPLISIAAQKNYIAIYHMGIYGNETLKNWFVERYAKEVPTKLNMGKSCIRMTNVKNIPYALLGELCEKITVDDWIQYYEDRNQTIC